MNIYKCLNRNKSTVMVVTAKSKFHAVRLIGLYYGKEYNEFESFESLLNSWKIIEINNDKEHIEFECDYYDKEGYYSSGYEEEFENRWFN